MNDIRKPDLIDAMITVIRNQSMNTETARLAAYVIAVDANLSARASILKNDGIEQDRMVRILDFSDEILDEARRISRAVEQGIDRFESDSRLSALINRILNYDI